MIRRVCSVITLPPSDSRYDPEYPWVCGDGRYYRSRAAAERAAGELATRDAELRRRDAAEDVSLRAAGMDPHEVEMRRRARRLDRAGDPV